MDKILSDLVLVRSQHVLGRLEIQCDTKTHVTPGVNRHLVSLTERSESCTFRNKGASMGSFSGAIEEPLLVP